MTERTVFVPDINCEHCTRTIELELGDVQGVLQVTANAASKEATVRFGPPARWEDLVAVLEEIGFPPSVAA